MATNNYFYKKQRILHHYFELLGNGCTRCIYSKVRKRLLEENIVVGRMFVRSTVKVFLACGKLYGDRGRRPSILSSNEYIKDIINNHMTNNDETTAEEIKQFLAENEHYVSISTINRIRRSLGWSLRGTRYCQLIRDANKPKRVEWVNQNINDDFNDVIWSDETSVAMEQFKRRCFRKKGCKPKTKPKPKHPLKLHVWAGISRKGPTKVCIFNGTMDANLYIEILQNTLVPFIAEKFPIGHRFMQDNDPKHRSKKAQTFFEENNINWWKTPAGM